MTISKIYIYIFTLAALFILPFTASGQEGEFFRKEAPVDIEADFISYDKESDTYFARGNAVIVQEDTTLTSDSVLIDMAAGVATAAGNVVIVDEGGNTLQGDDLQFDLKKKTAVLARGRLFFKEQNISIIGETMRKTGPQSYNADKVTFTTCDCEEGRSPAWSFYSTKANVTVGEFLTGKNTFFYIKGVPVLYSPYVTIPIKRERQSGFLPPKPGYSKLRGFILENSFFWAISKSTDATFYLDIEANRGTGMGAEYRYYRTRRSYGEAFFYYFKEKDIERVREFRSGVDNLSRPESANNTRRRFNLLHTEDFGSGLVLKADINIVSDDEYYIDFGRTPQERTLESIESNVSLTKSWSNYSLVTQFRFFNNLLLEDESSTIQRLPEVSFTGANRKIYDTPFYLSINSNFVNFERREGIRGQRLDLQPRVSLPLKPAGYFELTPSFSPRATFYYLDNDPNGKYLDRYTYEARVDMTTTFIRIFNPEFETLKSVRHAVRPRLAYSYIPQSVQTELPGFDGVDNIAPASAVTYAFNSTLTGKFMEDGVKRYHDFLYLDISQTYNFIEASRLLSSGVDVRRPFSDITAELIITPTERSAITSKATYDVYNDWFNTYNASLSLADGRGDSLYASYRYVRSPGVGTPGTSYLETSLRARVTKGVDLTYLKRYSFEDYRTLENGYGIEYTHQCWSASLTYSERLEERLIYLVFNLKGIGRVAGISGKLEPS